MKRIWEHLDGSLETHLSRGINYKLSNKILLLKAQGMIDTVLDNNVISYLSCDTRRLLNDVRRESLMRELPILWLLYQTQYNNENNRVGTKIEMKLYLTSVTNEDLVRIYIHKNFSCNSVKEELITRVNNRRLSLEDLDVMLVKFSGDHLDLSVMMSELDVNDVVDFLRYSKTFNAYYASDLIKQVREKEWFDIERYYPFYEFLHADHIVSDYWVNIGFRQLKPREKILSLTTIFINKLGMDPGSIILASINMLFIFNYGLGSEDYARDIFPILLSVIKIAKNYDWTYFILHCDNRNLQRDVTSIVNHEV